MRNDYVPSNNAVYDEWLANFVTILTANAATFGLSAADLEPIEGEQMDFANALSDHVSKKALERAAYAVLATKRRDSESVLRPLVQRIQKHPGMTDELRSLLGLPPRYMEEASTPISELIPLIRLETTPGCVTVHWGPNPGNEHENGKPEGVRSGNIYRKTADEEVYQLVGTATSSPYYDAVTGPATDYTYVVRYRGTKQYDLSKQSDFTTIAARGEAAA